MLCLTLHHYQDVDPCINGCLNELQASLGTIFLTRLATGSILKLAVPYFTQKMKRANEAKGVDPDDLTDVEQAYIQDVSDVCCFVCIVRGCGQLVLSSLLCAFGWEVSLVRVCGDTHALLLRPFLCSFCRLWRC
jgi:hypothetical protein